MESKFCQNVIFKINYIEMILTVLLEILFQVNQGYFTFVF